MMAILVLMVILLVARIYRALLEDEDIQGCFEGCLTIVLVIIVMLFKWLVTGTL